MLRLINNAFKKVGKEDWITGNMRRYFFIPQNVLGSTTSMTETVNKVALGKKKKKSYIWRKRAAVQSTPTQLFCPSWELAVGLCKRLTAPTASYA